MSPSPAPVPGQLHRMPSGDERVRAAAAVLAGESVGAVAERYGTDPAQLLRWTEALSAGGAAAVGGLGVDRPAEGPWASSVPVEDYLAVVMHELRTPLTAARAALSVLGRHDLDPALREQVSGTVLDRLAGMDQLCQDVLETVAVATGRTAPQPERLDLAELARETCSIAGTPFPRRLPVVVDGDPAHLRRALSALVQHVQRYAGPDQLQVQLQAVGGAALLTVRAAGVRLTADEAAALFEPFGAAARGDGNGLALYVVRTLLVASGGQVGVAGDQDATVFWVRLPLAP